jgi:enoyl-CoA hydratase/carnithine racemase
MTARSRSSPSPIRSAATRCRWDLRAALQTALAAALADPAVRAIVLTGEGEHFCAAATSRAWKGWTRSAAASG